MTKRSRAEVRHKYFGNKVCQAHVIFPKTPLCPENKVLGTDLCRDHATEIATRLGWKPKPAWTRQQQADLKALNEELVAVHRELTEARQERDTLSAEVSRLTDLTPAQRRQEQRTTDGTVYALLSGYNVKVGWTGRDLQERLREYPPSTQLLVHFPGARGDETRIKRKFAHLKTHGNEWFPYAPQVTEWVDQMTREHGEPDPDITCGPAKYTVPRPHADKMTATSRGSLGKIA